MDKTFHGGEKTDWQSNMGTKVIEEVVKGKEMGRHGMKNDFNGFILLKCLECTGLIKIHSFSISC